jgi:hypothetical protein
MGTHRAPILRNVVRFDRCWKTYDCTYDFNVMTLKLSMFYIPLPIHKLTMNNQVYGAESYLRTDNSYIYITFVEPDVYTDGKRI